MRAFPDAGGQQRAVTGRESAHRTLNVYGDFGRSDGGMEPRGGAGTAARFFYSSKADASDRLQSKHPTVKPVDLMRWLVRLITPPSVFVCESCDKVRYDNSTTPPGSAETLRDVPTPIQANGQPEAPSLLQPPVCGDGDAANTSSAMPPVQQRVSTGQGVAEDGVLLKDVREQGNGGEAEETISHDAARVSAPLSAGAPTRDKGGLHHGASPHRGGDARPTASEERGGASQERPQVGQSTDQSKGDAETGTRQGAEAATETDQLPPLRRQDRSVRACPSCGGPLVERRSVVLDPFAGSGTTGMACMVEGFDCILVEREAEYVNDIRRRIAHVSGQDAPLFNRDTPPERKAGTENLRPIRGRRIGPTGMKR